MPLPETLHFPGIGPKPHVGAECFYRIVAKRKPLAGEWFLSGAIPQAYRATQDLPSIYSILVPTHYAETKTVRGAPVVLPTPSGRLTVASHMAMMQELPRPKTPSLRDFHEAGATFTKPKEA